MSYLRNNKVLLLITTVLLVANIGLLYFFVFNKPQKTSKQPPVNQVEKVKNEVGLNDEQAVLYDSLRTKQFRNMKPLFKAIIKSKEDFFSLIY